MCELALQPFSPIPYKKRCSVQHLSLFSQLTLHKQLCFPLEHFTGKPPSEVETNRLLHSCLSDLVSQWLHGA